MPRFTRLLPVAGVALGLAACSASSGGRTTDPALMAGADAGASQDTTPRGTPTAAVRFLQGMIHHHAQALTMVAMIPSRTTRDEMRLLGERIAVSQRDEIASMRRWLERHGEYAPAIDSAGTHRHDAPGAMHEAQPLHEGMHHDMPGMLSADELERLASAAGMEFERLFLELMIRHHEGALVMVQDLIGTPGAAQEPELFGLASEIDADQRAEIQRMRTMLRAMGGGGPGR